ncbi:hypothetical protein FRB98_003490 [Tulasnella sp. 332]|nr:hypothetical protein FRB98_003490 [Tulasnella sp. 332]
MQSITSFFESVPSHHAGSSLPKVRKSPPSDPGTIRYTTDSHKRLKSSHIASTEGGEGASHVPQTTTKAEREVAVLYDPDPEQSRASSNTTLSHKLYLLGKNLPFLHPQSTAARHISKDLGPMAADMVWLQWEKSQSELSLTPNLHGKYDDNLKEPGPYITSTDVLTNVRQAIQTWASSSPSYQFCSDTQSELLNVSHKFVKLCDILNVFTDREPEFRAVIVVRHSFTARMLTTMIMSLMKTVKPQVLLGSDSNNGAQSMGCITNRNILRDFQEGNVNLLIIVSAVEASLNLPPVTCVIRWDPPDDYLAYAYSKAWLRPSGGTLVIMYEKGNRSHRRVMWHLRRMEPKWRTWMEESMNDNREKTFAPPCNMLYNDHFDEIAREDELGRDEAFLSDPVTSAKLYLSDSVRVVYMYVTRMSRLRGGAWNDELLFEYESVATSTRCHVWFSEPSPLRVFTGPICATRADARHLACFLACQELYRRCLLESTDWPTPRPSRALSFDDDLDDGVECQAPIVAPLTTEDARARMGKLKQLQYPQIQGEFWRRTLSAPPLRLFPTVFTLQGTPSNKTCHPICVMTRLPLPSITPFNIGPPGSSRTAHLRRGGAVNLTEEEVIALHQFTTLLCRTIYRKPVTLSIELCACLFAPLSSSWIDAHPPEDDIAPVHDMRDFIAWKETKRMGALMTARPRLSVESASSLIEDTKDALIQENNSQCSPLFEVAGISTTLNPTSKILSGGAEADYPNITEYLKVIRLPENTHPIKEDQPLMLVSSTPAHRDYFHHPTRPETTKKSVAIPPVLARIDDVMVSKELNATLFENRIDDSILADALTATSAERGHDYERLELLGESSPVPPNDPVGHD